MPHQVTNIDLCFSFDRIIDLIIASDSNTDTPVVSVDDQSFCAVQWENSSIVCTVSQSAIFKSPEFTRVNDICFIEVEGRYRKGQVIFKG